MGCTGATEISVTAQFHPFITLKKRITSAGTVAQGYNWQMKAHSSDHAIPPRKPNALL
jgi:hypothetical protein